MKRKAAVLAAVGVMAAWAGFGAFGDGGVKLRGYGGAVKAEFGERTATFTAENAAVASNVHAKLLKDLAGLSAARPEYAEGVFTFASGRKAAVRLDGRQVRVGEPGEVGGRGVAETGHEYPAYLDYYDLRALKFYKRPMDSFKGYGLENHWKFAHKVGIGGMVCHGIDFAGTIAPGVYPYTQWDFAVEEAAKAGGMLTLSPTFAGQMPLWMYNEYPEKCAKPQRRALVTEWIQGVEGMPFDNDGPGFPDGCSPTLSFQKETIERYADNPGLGGWQFYCGKPIGDQLGKGMFGLLWDSSEEGLAAQKEWLKRRYTLRGLGERWTGNADAYRSWGDVPDMELVELVGGDWDADRLDLFKVEWEWLKAPERRKWNGKKRIWEEDEKIPVGVEPPEGAKWLKVQMPPSHRCLYVEGGRCWYRCRLGKSGWLEKWKGKELHFRTVIVTGDGKPFWVWANGKRFRSDPGKVMGMVGCKIAAGVFRNDGTDELTVEMPDGRCNGRMAGPASLSPNAAENFPYRDGRTNARYVDNVQFQNDKIVERNMRVFLAGRALDRNRPMAISGADTPILSEMAGAFGENGFAMQSTSTDGFYWPNLPDMGRQYGFYFIGEPSADVAREDRFDRNFGTIFYTGASSTAVFMDIEQYMEFEEKTGGMTRRMPVTRLVGKYLIDEPRTAVLNSTLTSLLQTGSEYSWNLLRGEMQAVHFDAAMTTEKAMAAGLVTPEKYPLMLDCGADVMDEDLVDAVEKYVREGGTFVAFTETGRHTPERRDAHPFARVSGFETTDFEGGNVAVEFGESGEFPLWKGRKFAANGYGKYTGANWKWNRMLKKTAEDAEVAAVWKPSGKPAAGVRRLGKGKVITIASGFWREARDIRGKWVPSRYNKLTEELLVQLGAKRNADASNHNIWTRKATSKDGLEDWLIAFNIVLDGEREPVAQESTLAFAAAERPVRVYDAFTGKDAEGWTYEDGWVKLPKTEFGPYKTRIFAAAKPIPVAQGLKTWWGEKVKYWKAGPEQKLPRFKPMRAGNVTLLNEWEMSADGGKTWRKAKPMTWKMQFADMKDYRGKALYRTTFRMGEEKRGKGVLLNFGIQAFSDRATVKLNGAKVCEYDQAKMMARRELTGRQSHEVGGLMRWGGENVVEVEVEGGSKLAAGICDYVWISEEREFAERVSLKGEWEAVAEDLHTVKPAVVPGKAYGRYLRRKVFVPAGWAGKRVFFRLSQPANAVSAVVVNGVGRNGGGLAPFGMREEVNVTELVRPGEVNEIELWHRRTVPVIPRGKAWGWKAVDWIEVGDAELGVE